MKRPIRFIYLISFALSLVLLAFTPITYAKDVNLYDQPKDGSKLIGSVDVAQGVIPVFTQPDGKWMEVGDPRNGNVGWIKSTDLIDPKQPYSSIRYTQQIIRDSNGVPHTYQIMQFGQPSPMDQKQAAAMAQQIQQQQNNMQQPFQNTIKALADDINKLYQQQQKLFINGMPPVVIPVILYPQQNSGQAKPQPAAATGNAQKPAAPTQNGNNAQ